MPAASGHAIARVTQFFGYAHENVARVTVRLADGRQFTAQTFPGWKESGMRLWAMAPGPANLALRLRYVALGYDAAGHVVWQEASASG